VERHRGGRYVGLDVSAVICRVRQTRSHARRAVAGHRPVRRGEGASPSLLSALSAADDGGPPGRATCDPVDMGLRQLE